MAAAFKIRGKKLLHHCLGHAESGDALAKAEDVGVIVFARGARLEFARAQGRANAGKTVCRDAHSDAGAANKYSAGAGVFKYLFANLFRDKRIIAAFG